jgi:hypothetical protein
MRRILHMLVLVLAGELIFSLPFHTARFFRPTLLDAFAFSNTELGDAFAVYGLTAMLSYFPGGALADRFAARKLMSLSLLATAAGGLYMATLPGFLPMTLLYGYWGVTTIFLFWGAMIRAAREWGGRASQGMAFGILDGGRGRCTCRPRWRRPPPHRAARVCARSSCCTPQPPRPPACWPGSCCPTRLPRTAQPARAPTAHASCTPWSECCASRWSGPRRP